MFLKVKTLVLSVSIAVSFSAQATTPATSTKAKLNSTAAKISTTKMPTAKTKNRALVATTQDAQKSEIALSFKQETAGSNASFSTNVLQPVQNKNIFQVTPVSSTRSLEISLKTAATTQSIRTQAIGVQYARGLNNDLALFVGSDIGQETSQFKGEKDRTNSGLSDLKVEIQKMNSFNMGQSFFSGFVSSGLAPAVQGNFDSNQSLEGNRFSGGIAIGGAFKKQTASLSKNFGYSVSANLLFPRKQDIKQTSPIYSAQESTGGHQLAAEIFAESVAKGSLKFGGSAGLAMIMPTDISTRIGTATASSSIGQQNVLSMKAFLALASGQVEFVPAIEMQRSLGASTGGSIGIDSQDSLGIQLMTRFSL